MIRTPSKPPQQRSSTCDSRFGEQSARSGHRLNVLAALFFPLTALTSFFGMNLPLGMEKASLWSTAVVLLGGCALGGAMLSWVTGVKNSKGE